MNPLLPEDLLPPDYQGWNYDSTIFEKLVEETDAYTIFEVGTWKGMSARKLYKAAEARGRGFRLVCCDTWLGGIEHMPGMAYGGLFPTKYGYPQLYYQFLSNMQHSGCIDHLETLCNSSINCARWLRAKDIDADLIYIDASHEEPDVLLDLEAFWPTLNEGGIMFGDDWNYPPVSRCVQLFAQKNALKYEIVENNYWKIKRDYLKN
jgi:predicted O-methyltransferase YrrM